MYWLTITIYLIGVLVSLLIILLPNVYHLSTFSNVYDLFTVVGSEFKITKPTNIVSTYFISQTFFATTNITFRIIPETNLFDLTIGTQSYSFSLSDKDTFEKVAPILLLRK